MLDWPAMTTALAEQEPWWEPGTAHPRTRALVDAVYACL
jgi:hypothetical protein